MIDSIFSNEISYAIFWTIIHSTWQISLVALILYILIKSTKEISSVNNYILSLSALGISLLISLVTFSYYFNDPQSTEQVLENSLRYQASLMNNPNSGVLTAPWLEQYKVLIFNTWFIGSMIFLCKFLFGYVYIKKIIGTSEIVTKDLAKSLKKLNKKFKIHREFLIRQSAKITTPIVVGFFKPVILFPVGLINNLSTDEIEAILAHEMAHIIRHDYLINIIHSFAEIVFYYHPAMWFISSNIRKQRENCCDDLAIQYTGSSISYAKTLIKLQELKVSNFSVALAFTGNHNDFKNRILRLVGSPDQSIIWKDKMLLIICLLSGLFLNFSSEEETQSAFDIYIIDDCPKDPEEIKFYLDTIPYKNSFSITKRTQNQQIEVLMEEGIIQKLVVDGEQIPKSEIKNHSYIIEDLIPDHQNDVITLFPECGESFGKIYWLDRTNNQTINLDSMLTKLKDEKSDLSSIDFALDQDFNVIHEMLIDTISQEVFNEEYHHLVKPYRQPMLDSVFELLPQNIKNRNIFEENKMPLLYDGDHNISVYNISQKGETGSSEFHLLNAENKVRASEKDFFIREDRPIKELLKKNKPINDHSENENIVGDYSSD